ncbi:S-methylmethionine--homocysteine S-methyltransferase BHMT2-like [Glandiceps talaboti]
MEDKLELINREALRLGREVADETGTLLAGNICNTDLYHPDSPGKNAEIKAMFKEMIDLTVQYNVDFIIGETFTYLGEAMIALEAIKEYGNGVPAVINLAPYVVATKQGYAITGEKIRLSHACRMLEDAGADVVGLNCSRGPATMLPLMTEVRRICKGPLAAVPVPYRTTEEEPTYFTLCDPETGKPLYPMDLEVKSCSHKNVADFGKQSKELGFQLLGLCCGNRPSFTRTLAESLGRKPEASRYSSDMSKSVTFGTNNKVNKDVAASYKTLYFKKVELEE